MNINSWLQQKVTDRMIEDRYEELQRRFRQLCEAEHQLVLRDREIDRRIGRAIWFGFTVTVLNIAICLSVVGK